MSEQIENEQVSYEATEKKQKEDEALNYCLNIVYRRFYLDRVYEDSVNCESYFSYKDMLLLNEDNNQWQKYKKDKATISETEINSNINLRNKARANKDYKEADRIRDYLFDKGVLIEDKDGKTLWKFK